MVSLEKERQTAQTSDVKALIAIGVREGGTGSLRLPAVAALHSLCLHARALLEEPRFELKFSSLSSESSVVAVLLDRREEKRTQNQYEELRGCTSLPHTVRSTKKGRSAMEFPFFFF